MTENIQCKRLFQIITTVSNLTESVTLDIDEKKNTGYPSTVKPVKKITDFLRPVSDLYF